MSFSFTSPISLRFVIEGAILIAFFLTFWWAVYAYAKGKGYTFSLRKLLMFGDFWVIHLASLPDKHEWHGEHDPIQRTFSFG